MRLLALTLLLLALGACAAPPPDPTPRPTLLPTVTPAAAPTAKPTAADPTASLEAFVAAELQPQLAGAYADHGEEAAQLLVRPLAVASGAAPLWAVFSTGMADPASLPHFVAIYTRAEAGWREQGRVELLQTPIVTAGSLRQVELGGGRLWLVSSGASGLVGPCCVELLSYDGGALRSELSFVDRTVTGVSVEGEATARPALVISVTPWRGAAAPPAPLEVHRFVWDGSAVIELT